MRSTLALTFAGEAQQNRRKCAACCWDLFISFPGGGETGVIAHVELNPPLHSLPVHFRPSHSGCLITFVKALPRKEPLAVRSGNAPYIGCKSIHSVCINRDCYDKNKFPFKFRKMIQIFYGHNKAMNFSNLDPTVPGQKL